MIKGLKWTVQYCFVVINLIVVVAMIFCAYSYRLNSAEYPDFSYWGMIFPVFLFLSFAFILFWLVFKRRFMLLSIIGMLICADAIRTFCPINLPSSTPEGAIKVLSYNVMSFPDNDKVEWEDNIVFEYVRKSGADIVCLQEAGGVPYKVLHDLCDTIYPYIAVDTIIPKLHLMMMSKFPIVSMERINYESGTNGSVAYKIVKDEDTILVVNNHLESYKLQKKDKDDYETIIKNPKDEENEIRYDSLVSKLKSANVIRAAQVDSIAQFIANSGCKYVICAGDFNAPSLSYTHYRLTRLLNDAYTRSGCGMGFSYNQSGMYFRIDNILISENMKAYGAKVDDYSRMSDHYPIYAWLELLH